MMKKILIFTLVGLRLNCLAIDFSGRYMCNGYDTKDGTYKDILTLKSLPAHSNPAKDLFAYSFSLNEEKTNKQIYSGSAISVGNNASIYFKNVDPTKTSDAGVGLAMVSSLSKNSKGHQVPATIKKFYYEQDYVSDGHEDCTRIEK